jgi:hypothetical protein
VDLRDVRVGERPEVFLHFSKSICAPLIRHTVKHLILVKKMVKQLTSFAMDKFQLIDLTMPPGTFTSEIRYLNDDEARFFNGTRILYSQTGSTSNLDRNNFSDSPLR